MKKRIGMKLKEMSLPGPPQELSPQETTAIKTKIYPKLKPTEKTIENIELHTADLGNNGIFFALVKNNDILTLLNVVRGYEPFPTNNKKETLWIKRSYTPRQHRRKGYSEALYSGLADIGYRIVSDTQVGNPGAKQIWIKLEKRGRVKHWNASTKQFIELGSNTDPYNTENIVHILEGIETDIPKLKSSILGDRIFWTHPDVVSGKF